MVVKFRIFGFAPLPDQAPNAGVKCGAEHFFSSECLGGIESRNPGAVPAQATAHQRLVIHDQQLESCRHRPARVPILGMAQVHAQACFMFQGGKAHVPGRPCARGHFSP